MNSQNNKETRTDYSTNKKLNFFKSAVSFICVIAIFFAGFFVNKLINGGGDKELNEIIRLIKDVGYVIDSETLEPKEITREQLVDAIVDGVFDEYSEYYTAEEYVEIQQSYQGNNTGVGITFYNEDLIIDKVLGNSSADLKGVKRGDKIVGGSKDGDNYSFTDFKALSNFLKSVQQGQTITLNVLRGSESLTFELLKDDFKTSYITYYDNEVKYSFKTNSSGYLSGVETANSGIEQLPMDVALIEFTSFEGQAGAQLKDALDFMARRQKSKLILDLRSNGGGMMSVLTDVCGSLIYNQGKNNFTIAVVEGKKNTEYYKTANNEYKTNVTSIAVIANEFSASASECLIGAMAHYGGAFSLDKLIIERGATGKETTYGKGIMQTTYLLNDNSALKLTTAKVLWPDGRTCIHGTGISPTKYNVTDINGAISMAISVL